MLVFGLTVLLLASCSQEKTPGQQGVTQGKIKLIVQGNCEMCAERIETALSAAGIKKPIWNSETKILQADLSQTSLSLQEVASIVALAGHDNELVKASDEAYNNLPDCCKYDRTVKSAAKIATIALVHKSNSVRRKG